MTTALTTLLEDAAEHHTPIDVAADLRRGHRRLQRRRTRIAATLTGGLVLLGAVGVPVIHDLTQPSAIQPATDPGADAIHTPYYDAPPPPAGWQLEGAMSGFLSLIPVGTLSTNLDRFVPDKIVVLLHTPDENMAFGPAMQYDGRTFYDNETNAEVSIINLHLADGRWLGVQYPKGAGLTTQQMIEFLDGVVVKPAACIGSGC